MASLAATHAAELQRLKDENRQLRSELYKLLRNDPSRKRVFERFSFCGSAATYPKCRGHDPWDAGPDCNGYG